MQQSQTTRRQFLTASAALGVAALARPILAADAPPFRVGIYTRPWAKYEYTVAFDAIAGAGFKYVGLMTTKSKNGLILSIDSTPADAENVKKEAQKRGLSITSVWGGGFPLKTPEGAIEGLKKLIDLCAVAGATNLLMGGVGRPEQHDPYYAAIAACCDYAAEKKIGLSLKPHGGSNSTGPQCRKTIEKLNNKNFKIWYDPGNIFFYSDGKLDPVDDAPSVDGLVVGMSVKDFDMAPTRKVDLTPGTGKVNFPKVMAALKKGGFTTGDLVIECLAPGDLQQTAAEAKKAREFVEKLVAGM